MQVQKSFKGQSNYGTLYLVPTPIGNLQDMTFRSVQILKEVDLICAEDTRNTGLLLKHFEIETKQYSFHEHNAYEKIPDLLERLKSGLSLAQVSDAGMPSISDPGHDLVKAAIAEDIPVVALPGASAGITALIASGLAPQPHIFYGFLPRKKGQQIDFFKEKLSYPETQIFYESPYRVADTLENMHEIYGNRQVTLVRELTKLYEECVRGPLDKLAVDPRLDAPKGEIVVVVGPGEEVQATEADADAALIDALQTLSTGDAASEVAKALGLNRKTLYRRALELKGK